MPSICLYADQQDVSIVLQKLNTDPDIALIVQKGRNRWIAEREFPNLADGRYYLWHVPTDRLPIIKSRARFPLFRKTHRVRINGKLTLDFTPKEVSWVENPWVVWQAEALPAYPSLPCLPSSPEIIELGLRAKGTEYPGAIGMSCFGWIGDRYCKIGYPAQEETKKWWRNLRNWIARNAEARVPRFGPLDSPNPEIWAFPSAYAKIAHGTKQDMNPFL
jgi:hypothetical protein